MLAHTHNYTISLLNSLLKREVTWIILTHTENRSRTKFWLQDLLNVTLKTAYVPSLCLWSFSWRGQVQQVTWCPSQSSEKTLVRTPHPWGSLLPLMCTMHRHSCGLTCFIFIYFPAWSNLQQEMVQLNCLFLNRTKYLVHKELYQREYFQRALGGSSAWWFFTEICYLEGGMGRTSLSPQVAYIPITAREVIKTE